MKQVSESLAGRAVYFTLSPMTWGEMNELPVQNLGDDFFNGHFPAEKKSLPLLLTPCFLCGKDSCRR
jgi:predicted AAA+ superfamily ATPase